MKLMDTNNSSLLIVTMRTFSPNTSQPQTPKPLVRVSKKPQFIRNHSTIPFPIPLSQSSPPDRPRRRAFSFFPFLFSTRRKASTSTAASSSSSAYPSSQNTSDTQVDSPRVRQLDKATRTLGERIPPELVVGPPKSPQHCIKPRVPLRTRSSSPSLFPPTSRPTPEPRHKRSYLNIVRCNPQVPEPDAPNMSRPPSRTSTEEETSRYLKTLAKTPPPGTPFVGSAVDSDSDSSLGSRKKWQQSWSGEWNVKDMHEVIGKLRDLH